MLCRKENTEVKCFNKFYTTQSTNYAETAKFNFKTHSNASLEFENCLQQLLFNCAFFSKTEYNNTETGLSAITATEEKESSTSNDEKY